MRKMYIQLSVQVTDCPGGELNPDSHQKGDTEKKKVRDCSNSCIIYRLPVLQKKNKKKKDKNESLTKRVEVICSINDIIKGKMERRSIKEERGKNERK